MHRAPCDLPILSPVVRNGTSTFRQDRDGENPAGHQAPHLAIT